MREAAEPGTLFATLINLGIIYASTVYIDKQALINELVDLVYAYFVPPSMSLLQKRETIVPASYMLFLWPTTFFPSSVISSYKFAAYFSQKPLQKQSYAISLLECLIRPLCASSLSDESL